MKRTPLKRSKKPLRRKAKGRSELVKLVEKADRALQDFFRSLNLLCEVCGAKQEVIHHYIPKSSSFGLRYKPQNLIKLCNKCHARHHLSPDTFVQDTIILKRGIDWLKSLELLRLETKGQRPEKEELERLIRIYEKNEPKTN